MTISNAQQNRSEVIYSKMAELLLACMLLVFIYPFFYLISGVDPTVPYEAQSEIKIIYYLQIVFPFLCLALALLYRGSDVCLPGAIMIYPLVCLASATWSVNPYDTFKESSLLIAYIVAIAAISQILHIQAFCKTIVRVLAFLMLASVVTAVALPQYGTHQLDDALGDARVGLWRGVFGHKNQLGAAASTSTFIFLFFRGLIGGSVGFQVICIVAAIACLTFAQSAGSWIALCILVFYYLMLRTAPLSRNLLLLIVFSVSAVGWMVFFFFGADLVALVGRDPTFTGRTDIWRTVIDAIREQPALGFGYYAGTHDFIKPLLVGELFTAAVDPHNGYLDVMLGTGAVGLILLLFCIASVVITVIDRAKMRAGPETDFFWLLLAFPILSLLFSFFETEGISGVHDLLDVLTFLSLTAIPLYLRLGRGSYEVRTSSADTRSASPPSANGGRGKANWTPQTPVG